jgi:hypothetical protein
MKVFEYLDRISRMHRMLIWQHTGTPSEFASQLGVSRTTLYEMIDELKSRGAPISYSKSSCTFFYTEPFEINVSCSLRPLNQYEEKQLIGGNFFGRVLLFRTLWSLFGIVKY